MRKTENFTHGLCTPLMVDMDRVVMIERRPDPNKMVFRFETGWSVEVEPVAQEGETTAEAVERVIDRWSGRTAYPDMVECWSDQQGPVDGSGHIWIDLSACLGFNTDFGPLGRMMEVQLHADHAPRWFWLRHRADISQEEQSAELFKRWRRARGEKV